MCVLKNVFHFQNDLKNSRAESVILSTDLLIDFYEKQGRATQNKSAIKRKLLRLLHLYRRLCKGKTRRSANQMDKEAKFKQLLRGVFPVEIQFPVSLVNLKRVAPKKKKAKEVENLSEPSDNEDANFVPSSEIGTPPKKRRLRRTQK